jgi:hypothetical protein
MMDETESPVWWVQRHGERRGPYTRAELLAMSSGGELRPGDRLWKDGLARPVAPTAVPGLAPMAEPRRALLLAALSAIWFDPRRAMALLLPMAAPPWLLLLLPFGAINALDYAARMHLGEQHGLAAILFTVCVIGPLLAVLGLYAETWVLAPLGQWLGGKANARQLRLALAWSTAPLLLGFLYWIPVLLFTGDMIFHLPSPVPGAAHTLRVLVMWHEVLQGTLQAWSFVLALILVSELEGFGGWRALACMLICAVLLVLIGWVLAFMVAVIMGFWDVFAAHHLLYVLGLIILAGGLVRRWHYWKPAARRL